LNENITSFDAAEPGQFGDILNLKRREHTPVKVGLLAVGYFEYWRMYPTLRATVEMDLEKIRGHLASKVDVIYPGMVDSMDRAEEAGRAFAQAGVNVVVVAEGTYLPDFIVLHALNHTPHAHVILLNTQTGSDVNPSDGYEATLRNSALIGVTQLSGSFCKAKRNYDVVVGEISDERCYEEIACIVRARAAVKQLQSYNIGLVGHVFRGMFDLEFDRGSVRGRLGPEVITIQPEHLVEAWKVVSEEDVTRQAAALTQRFQTRHITQDDVQRSVRLGLAMRGLAQQYRLDALCFLGQHYIEKIARAPARLGASMLMEQDGFMASCEGDVGGLIVMQIMHSLTGNVPVQMEWGQFDTRHNALFLLGHGIGSPELAAHPSQVTLTRAPEEWGFDGNGANWEMIVRPGPVTLGHLLSTPTGWRLLISEGEALDFPCLPCDEIHAMVRVATPVCDYLAHLMKHGITHHVILVHGRVLSELERVADILGLEKLVAR
jgi:L-arabinose isomerase